MVLFCFSEPCQDPGRPQNGWALGSNYNHGSVVRFVCKNQTYDRIGASNITCKDGKWSDPTPSCEGKSSKVLYCAASVFLFIYSKHLFPVAVSRQNKSCLQQEVILI